MTLIQSELLTLRDMKIYHDKWLEHNGIFPYKNKAFNHGGQFIIPAFTYKGFPFPSFVFAQEVHNTIREKLAEIDTDDDLLEYTVNNKKFGSISRSHNVPLSPTNGANFLFYASYITLNQYGNYDESTGHSSGYCHFNIYQEAKDYVNE